MMNLSKHSANFRVRMVRVALVTALALFAVTPASAAVPPPENPGCETYGCVYEQCASHFTRGGVAQACTTDVVHETLPEAPGRHLLEVNWPGHYDPARRPMWDRVAFCESTWRWQYNGPSGFDGGLQFTPSTWRAFGGGEYGAYAWQATAEQQIDIAERVAFYGHGANRPQGPRAWPNCGYHLTAP